MCKIKKLVQPKSSNLCGQTIIAMLGDISILEVVEVIDKTGTTTTKDMIRGLNIFGIKTCSDKLIRIPKNWIKPQLCVVKIRFDKTWKSHWVLWNGQEGRFYDPDIKYMIEEDFYALIGARMTSYLEVKRNKKEN